MSQTIAALPALLGMRIAETGDGTAVIAGEPSAGHLQPAGVVHGGYAMTMLDTAMAVAIMTRCGPGRWPATLELSTNFTRGLQPDAGTVTATGTIRHLGGRTATATADLHDAEGRLCGHASCVCLLVDG